VVFFPPGKCMMYLQIGLSFFPDPSYLYHS
jgi:hypothetical protein